MNFFAQSRLKKLFIPLIVIIVLLILAQTFISNILGKYKLRLVDYLSATFGYRLVIDRISFDFIGGARLKGISVFYNEADRAPVFIKEAGVYVRLLPLIYGKIVVGRIIINELRLLFKKEKEGVNLQIIYSDIYKRMLESKNLPLGISTNKVVLDIKTIKIIPIDNPYLEKNMLVSLKSSRIEYKSGKFKFEGSIKLTYRFLPNIARFLNNDLLEQGIKCMVQGNIEGNNLNMDLILLSIGKEEMIGMGVNKNFAERNPYLDINFIPANISLDNIVFLKNNLDAQGSLFILLKIYGLMDNPKIFLNALLENCNFKYHITGAKMFSIKNLMGQVEYQSGSFKINNAYLEFNDFPLNIKMQTSLSTQPDISLNVSLPQKFLFSHIPSIKKLEAEFKGSFKNMLVGNLEIRTLYVRKELNLDMRAYFKNIEFDYYNAKEKYLKADTLELTKDNTYKIQKLSFTGLQSNVFLDNNKFEIRDISFLGYNGRLSAKLSIDMADKAILNFGLKGERLDVKSLMHDMNLTDKLLGGKMAVKITFNNRLKEFLKGYCYIRDGMTDLDALTNYVKLPSLKDKQFDIMHAYFSISKDIIRLRGLRLKSPDIMLNAFCDTNNRINGVLNIKIASGLLNQSVQFRKLLNLARLKTEYIDFKFLLGGVPKAVRFMWMKGEFKEKIKQRLPGGIKKSIQVDIDKNIEELSTN
jgi:hypothetical protein